MIYGDDGRSDSLFVSSNRAAAIGKVKIDQERLLCALNPDMNLWVRYANLLPIDEVHAKTFGRIG